MTKYKDLEDFFSKVKLELDDGLYYFVERKRG